MIHTNTTLGASNQINQKFAKALHQFVHPMYKWIFCVSFISFQILQPVNLDHHSQEGFKKKITVSTSNLIFCTLHFCVEGGATSLQSPTFPSKYQHTQQSAFQNKQENQSSQKALHLSHMGCLKTLTHFLYHQFTIKSSLPI